MDPTRQPGRSGANGGTHLAPLVPVCPACRATLELATCTIGTVVRCPACSEPVALELKPGHGDHRGLTLAVHRPPELPEKLPGELAQRFEVVSRLGAGGQGEVLRVRPRGATRDFALKWTKMGEGEPPERGPREANYGVMPAHPNVMAPIQAGWHERLQYMVFDLVEGETLAAVLEREGPLPAPRACELAHQGFRALAHVHANGVIHRDVKPANMLLDRAGTLRLTDFGVATSVGAPPGDLLIGTPPYMSPEQVDLAPLTPASDVYAFGCVLFEMLTGHTPYERDALVDVLMARVDQPAPPVTDLAPGCPGPLASFVTRLLAREPSDRPADGSAALAELSAVQRACGLDEHLNLPVAPRSSERSAALERRRAVARLKVPGGAVLTAAGLITAVVKLAFDGGSAQLIWCLLIPAWGLLGAGLASVSRQRLGEPHAWWKSFIPPDEFDWNNVPGMISIGMGLFGVGLAVLVSLSLGSVLAFAVACWVLTLVLGARALLPSLLEIGEPQAPAGAPPELRALVTEDGWHYRLLPAGQEAPLPHRLELADGLNRLEVWRAGGRRRAFLLWASPGVQLEMRLRDAPDGPQVAPGSRPALPPARTASRP